MNLYSKLCGMEQDSSASVENDAVENEILLRESKVLGIEIGREFFFHQNNDQQCLHPCVEAI